MSNENTWELVVRVDPYSATYRMKVPNGWIYRHSNEKVGTGMVFVPEEVKTLRVEKVNIINM